MSHLVDLPVAGGGISSEGSLAEMIQRKSQAVIQRMERSELPRLSQAALVGIAYDTITLLRKRGVSWRLIAEIFNELGYSLSVAYLQTAYSRLRREREAQETRRRLEQAEAELQRLQLELSRLTAAKVGSSV